MAVGGLLHAIQFARHRPEPIRQASLLMVLASGVSQADVLAVTLRSLVLESEAPWSHSVQQLILLLEKGNSLSQSVSRVGTLLPEETVMVIRVAEENGTLEAVLNSEAMRLLEQPTEVGGTRLMSALISCLAVLTTMAIVLTYLMFKAIPGLIRIFEGFGAALPERTMTLIAVCDSVYQFGVIAWMPTAAGIIALCVVGWKIQLQLLSQGRSLWLEWRARHVTPAVLRILSLTSAAGTPLDEGLRCALAEMTPSRGATQLSRVRHDLRNGGQLPDALQTHGFVTQREARFLQSAAVTQHLDWAMRHLAGAVERQRLRTMERFGLIIPPVIILSVGVLVWFVVTALFLPLIHLISNVP